MIQLLLDKLMNRDKADEMVSSFKQQYCNYQLFFSVEEKGPEIFHVIVKGEAAYVNVHHDHLFYWAGYIACRINHHYS